MVTLVLLYFVRQIVVYAGFSMVALGKGAVSHLSLLSLSMRTGDTAKIEVLCVIHQDLFTLLCWKEHETTQAQQAIRSRFSEI